MVTRQQQTHIMRILHAPLKYTFGVLGDYYWKFSYHSSTFKVYGGFVTQNCNHVYEKILKVLTAKGCCVAVKEILICESFQSFLSFFCSLKGIF